MIKVYFGLLALFISGYVIAQQHPSAAQLTTIKTVVEGYNKQNFKQMKKPWGFIGQVLVTPKKLKKEFAPFYEKNGKAEIDTISCFSSYQCTALLKLEKNVSKRTYLNFIFNDKAKLQGFGFGGPLFIYRKQEQGPEQSTVEVKRNEIDSVFKVYTPSMTSFFSGCLLVQQGDETIYKNCNGYTNRDSKTPISDSSMFLLASCSKQFTAMAILLLIEKQQINETTKISDIIDSFPYPNLQIQDLLTHTSGLADYMPLLKKYWNENEFATNADVIQLLRTHQPPLKFEPGSSFDYSNTGYVILSEVIQKVSKQSYAEFLQKEIFDPLQMNRTKVIARRKENKTPDDYALGYVYSKGGYYLPDSLESYNYIRYMDGLTGDDGVSSCLKDQAIWNKAIKESTLISKELTQKMLSRNYLENDEPTDYGYGLFISSGKGLENMVYHTGYWPGYTTINMNFIDRDLSIIVLSNNSYRSTLSIADKAAAIAIRK